MSINQDYIKPDLLFAGTEYGVFFTINGGKKWIQLKGGLPTTAVRDLDIQERENDLVIGTHGRSVYILDDISPLRELSENLLKKKAHLFYVSDAYEYNMARTGSPPVTWFTDNTEFKGENEPYGARFTYYLVLSDSVKDLEGTEKEKKVSIEIMDKDSTVIRTFKGTMNSGINRAYWDLRIKAFDRPRAKPKEGEDRAGTRVLPGHYIVKLTAGSNVMSQEFDVKKDPRFNIDDDALKANYDFDMKVGELSETAAKMFNQVQATIKSIKTFNDFAANIDTSKSKDLKKQGKNLEQKLVALMNKITPDSSLTGIRNNSGILMSEIGEVGYLSFNPVEKPLQNAMVKFEKTKKIAEALVKEYNDIYAKDVNEFRKAVEASGFTIFGNYKNVELK